MAVWTAPAASAADLGSRLPSNDAFEAAVQAARPVASAQGISLHTDGLWQPLLAARVPLMAWRQGNRCHIGFTSFTPGRRFDGLFPVLPAAQAKVWLDGLVRHELAHCLEGDQPASALQTGALGPMAAWGPASLPHQRWREARADLAFAIHVDETGEQGEGLIERLLRFRQASAGHDPAHDSSPVLSCYLTHPARRADIGHASHLGEAAAGKGWRATLAVWQVRCPLAAGP